MNIEIKERFMAAWEKYFPGSELPIVCFYSNELGDVKFPDHPKPNIKGYTCIFSQIAPVKQGRSRAFNMENPGCFGSFLPFGFDINLSDDVKNYICNIERVKKSYKHVESMYKHRPPKEAPGKHCQFKAFTFLTHPQLETSTKSQVFPQAVKFPSGDKKRNPNMTPVISLRK